jgi:hypothetical protein
MENMYMEMNIDKLDLEKLPRLEIELLRTMMRTDSMAYAGGYGLESAINVIEAQKFNFLNNIQGVALLRVGSGSRLDGAGVGSQEFIVLTENETLYSNVIHNILHILSTEEWGVTVNTEVDCEILSLHKGHEQLLFYHSNNKPFPGRIIESTLIYGDSELLTKAKSLVLEQMNSTVIKKMKNELRTYKKVVTSGKCNFKKKLTTQFNKNLNEVYYNPEASIYGFKQAYIRFFQQAILIDILSLLVNRSVMKEELLCLPESMEEKLRFLIRKGWINNQYADYILQLGFTYTKLIDMQSYLKVTFYKEENKDRDTVRLKLKSGSICAIDDMIERYPNGKLLLIHNK